MRAKGNRELLQSYSQVIHMYHGHAGFNKASSQLHAASEGAEPHVSVGNNGEHVVEILKDLSVLLIVPHPELRLALVVKELRVEDALDYRRHQIGRVVSVICTWPGSLGESTKCSRHIDSLYYRCDQLQ